MAVPAAPRAAVQFRTRFRDVHNTRIEIAFFAGNALIDSVRNHMGDATPVLRRGGVLQAHHLAFAKNIPETEFNFQAAVGLHGGLAGHQSLRLNGAPIASAITPNMPRPPVEAANKPETPANPQAVKRSELPPAKPNAKPNAQGLERVVELLADGPAANEGPSRSHRAGGCPSRGPRPGSGSRRAAERGAGAVDLSDLSGKDGAELWEGFVVDGFLS